MEYVCTHINTMEYLTYGHGERGGEGEMYGENNLETYINICKIVNGNLLCGSGNSNRGSVST